ncbi:PKD domain-containing protein [Haladaptatus sp. AB618]|uniref:PKD domain-containing protein n=1 Tax=Haladaptatus sp. AB618 TaxID=2934173 RepID=UPI00209BFE71|nr:PKD domain-containing protein [Haladaptatus sp. AB618]MCO8254974.1 PKD domain-containing protein [Haladaptatus sp. AB618]
MEREHDLSDDQRQRWSPESIADGVSTSFELERRDFLKVASASAVLSALGTGAAASSTDASNAKTRPTIWTTEDRQNARENIQQYDWAKSQRDDAVVTADEFLDRFDTLDELWHFIPAQTVPRSSFLSPDYHWDNPFYDSWDQYDDPWKITDGEYVFPTNDFASYRRSGLDDKGMFDPELADDQYLVNEEHPEMGEGWGVDDGYGWQDTNDDLGEGEGAWWDFVAYYNHWGVWRPGGVVRMMRAFTDAFLLTGDQKYSRPCAILLDRIADVYPDMDVSAYCDPRAGGHYHNNTGGRQTGKIIGSHWEPNLIRPVMRAYDAIFPGMEGDQQLVDFLQGKVEEFPGLETKDSVGKIRKNIEDGLLREILPAAKQSQLAPARGQLPAVTISARILDEPNGYTRDALHWVFQPGREIFTGDVWYKEPEKWATTGGNVMAKLVDTEGRDGYFDESSPLYNPIAQAAVLDIGDLLRGYDGFDGADLYEHVKFHRIMHTHIPLIMLDKHTPLIGDAHPNRLYLDENSKRNAFEVYGEDIFGQTLHFINGFSTEGLRGDIFSEDPTQLREDVEAIIAADGPLDLGSTIQPSYGFTALRDGKNYKALNDGGTKYRFLSLEVIERSTGVWRPSEVDALSLESKDAFGENTLQLEANEPGQHITFAFEITDAGTYHFTLRPFESSVYGIYDIEIDGTVVDTYDFYDETTGAKGDFVALDGSAELSEGTHEITFRNVGKNDDASNYKMGIIQFETYDRDDWYRRQNAVEKGNAKRGIWTYYGRTGDYGNHTHRDTLNLGVMAYELDLAPDNGYPTLTGSWPRRRYWHKNTIAHNTVMVDERRQEGQRVAVPKHFDDTDMVQLSEVAAPQVYPQTDDYRRTTAMIHVDDVNSYGVDFFHIDGGDDHRFSFHGWVGDVATGGLNLVEQDGGTYAGPDVPKPENVANPDSQYNQEVGNGFNYLDNVARDDDPSTHASIDWDIEDYWGTRDDDADIHLRLTMLGDHDEIAVMDGHPPDTDNQPDTIKYVIARRTGTDIESTFTSVVEPYMSDRFIESTEAVPITTDGDGAAARAVKVELTNGRTDYVAYGGDSDRTYDVGDVFSFEGFFAVYSERDGEPVHAYLNDGRSLTPMGANLPLIDASHGQFTGTVEDFTREMTIQNELDVTVDEHVSDIDRAQGGQIYVQTDGLVNGVYPVHGTSKSGNHTTVDVGERTTIESFTNPDQLDDGGYEYYLSEGDEFYIPLSNTWKLLFASIDPSSTTATVGERLEFDADDTTGNDRWVESLEWDFGDGTSATGWWNDHRYDDRGEYTVELTATANDGRTTTDEITISVSDLSEPIARIQPSTTEPSTGEDVEFFAKDTTSNDRWIESLEWDFGDGTSATGWWTEHQYGGTGEHTVVLTATDNTGHSTTDEVTITVG